MTDEQAEYESFEEAVQFIRGLPMSWCPALLAHMVEAAYEKKVFVPGGASSFVHKVEVKDTAGVPDGSVGHVDDRRNLGDAVMLIVRLCRALEREHPVSVQALDWIDRKGLMPSVLR